MKIAIGQRIIDVIRRKDKSSRTFVTGADNKVLHKNIPVKYIPGLNIIINGTNNTVVVEDNTCNPDSYIERSVISINGDNNFVLLKIGAYGVFSIDINADYRTVEVGKKTGFSGSAIKLWENKSKVLFKDGSIIAKDVNFYCTDFHSIIDIETKKPINQGKEIIIGEHCWIGEGAKILKNVQLADNLIVATMSVVTKSLNESHAIYAGIPAKIVKRNVSWAMPKFDVLNNELSKQGVTL